MKGRDIVVVGGSAGALEGVLAITSSLGANLRLSLLILIHSSENTPGVIPASISSGSRTPARTAGDGESIRQSQVRVAPSSRHLLLKGNRIMRERRSRTACR